MSNVQFSLDVPRDWDDTAGKDAAVFGTSGWQALLESSFDCRTLYAWDDKCRVAITVFRAGPFAVGYLGFPAGSIVGEPTTLPSVINELKVRQSLRGIACLRVSFSAFGARPDLTYSCVSNPETAITNLQSWNLMCASKNLRRDIRKAERTGLEIDSKVDSTLGAELFGMYASTVKHHGGSLRYNAQYFSALLDLTRSNPAVKVYTAKHGADVAGFAVVIYHGDAAYYLHGASKTEFRQLSPSDLLLAEAIKEAASSNCGTFNFMASPPNQAGLIRYKEKWGGETRQMPTYTIPVSPAYPIFRIAETIYRRIS